MIAITVSIWHALKYAQPCSTHSVIRLRDSKLQGCGGRGVIKRSKTPMSTVSRRKQLNFCQSGRSVPKKPIDTLIMSLKSVRMTRHRLQAEAISAKSNP